MIHSLVCINDILADLERKYTESLGLIPYDSIVDRRDSELCRTPRSGGTVLLCDCKCIIVLISMLNDTYKNLLA